MKKTNLVIGFGIWITSLNTFSAATNTLQNCPASGGLDYICGMTNPEDLVGIPDSRWIISSGMAPNSGLHLIDTTEKTAERWVSPKVAKPSSPYQDCESQPEADEIQAHGISLRDMENGHAKLYVVNHGGKTLVTDLANGKGRETIEIFDIDKTQAKPTLTWQGCVAMPKGLVANAVVSDSKGAIYATVMLHPNTTPEQLWTNTPTGAIYRWSPDSQGFELLVGTELTGNNGIEISKDDKALYVVHMQGLSKFTATSPAVRLAQGYNRDGLGDNLHWVGDELIVSASRLENCPTTGADYSCMKGYHVSSVNPETLQITPLVKGENTDKFSGVSVGLPIGDTLWLGSFTGDRVAYRSMPMMEPKPK